MIISIKRVYEPSDKEDGFRILVDRLWPRGIKKDDLKYDLWAKDIAPGNDLRKWFEHDPEKWEVFKCRYLKELEKKQNLLKEIIANCEHDSITLLYSAKNIEMNQAVVIKSYIEDKFINKIR